jgi:hypothetical protein
VVGNGFPNRRAGTGRDRTGDQVGSMTVLGRDEEEPRRWRVRWKCCGRELVVTTDYIQSRTRSLPTRCRACVVDGQATSERALRDRQRKQDLRITEAATPKADPQVTIYSAGLWWGPELGRLGPRNSRN